MCNVQCAMCNVQCVMCNVQCAMCNVQCAMRIHLYALRLEQLSLYDGLASCIEKTKSTSKSYSLKYAVVGQ